MKLSLEPTGLRLTGLRLTGLRLTGLRLTRRCKATAGKLWPRAAIAN